MNHDKADLNADPGQLIRDRKRSDSAVQTTRRPRSSSTSEPATTHPAPLILNFDASSASSSRRSSYQVSPLVKQLVASASAASSLSNSRRSSALSASPQRGARPPRIITSPNLKDGIRYSISSSPAITEKRISVSLSAGTYSIAPLSTVRRSLSAQLKRDVDGYESRTSPTYDKYGSVLMSPFPENPTEPSSNKASKESLSSSLNTLSLSRDNVSTQLRKAESDSLPTTDENAMMKELEKTKKLVDSNLTELLNEYHSNGLINDDLFSRFSGERHPYNLKSHIVHSKSWPSLFDMKTLSKIATIVSCIRQILEMPPKLLVKGDVSRELMTKLHQMLLDYRYEPVIDQREEDLLSKVIYVFSSCAQLIEFYHGYMESSNLLDQSHSNMNSASLISLERPERKGSSPTSSDDFIDADSKKRPPFKKFEDRRKGSNASTIISSNLKKNSIAQSIDESIYDETWDPYEQKPASELALPKFLKNLKLALQSPIDSLTSSKNDLTKSALNSPSPLDSRRPCKMCEQEFDTDQFEKHLLDCEMNQEIIWNEIDNNLIHLVWEMDKTVDEQDMNKSLVYALIGKIRKIVKDDKAGGAKLAKYSEKLGLIVNICDPLDIIINEVRNQTGEKIKLFNVFQKGVVKRSQLHRVRTDSVSSFFSLNSSRRNLSNLESPKKTVFTFISNLLKHDKSSNAVSSDIAATSIKDFEIIKPISKGAHGKVYLTRKKGTTDIYAIKALRKSDMIRKNLTTHALAEKTALSLADAPFVVKLYFAFQSPHYLYLVMEYVVGGDVASLLRVMGTLEEDTARFYTAEVALALEYLHHNGIIHRDIKPDNMLITKDGHLKLTDFGLSKVEIRSSRWQKLFLKPKKRDVSSESVKSLQDQQTTLGTPDYLAPELLLGVGHDFRVDYWSLGVCVYEFLYGIPPFNHEKPEMIFKNILNFQSIRIFMKHFQQQLII